ncbi:phospholipase effector Tle1 domain-containing protein [Salinivibrio kushneri]|uniref:phospholipase effector Tle1 domain-containing protein n=1 Tax=Salinivibrio kushneri TaxID=1908198 RepID=UPI000988E10C|nr:DUF2235 domain-containing protein [Salinivibrio kushneri]
MAYEFGQVEGDIEALNERDLNGVMPDGVSFSQFKEKLSSGEVALLTDTPSMPAMLYDSTNKLWSLSPDTETTLSPQTRSALAARANQSGSVAGGVGESGGVSHSAHAATNIEDTYVPEPVKPDRSDAPPPLKYEYCFEIASSDKVFSKTVGCKFELAKTQQEGVIGDWQTARTEHGTKYTTYTAFNEPKKLVAKIASASMGISVPESVQMKPIGSGVIQEAFIPVTPSVQLDERLGLPTEGYYYHFHQKRLVQEYKLLGDGKWQFFATRSKHDRLNQAQGFNRYQSAILVYWKIGGKEVEDQHLVYLKEPITQDALDNLNDEWLAENGIKLSINELLAAPKQAIAKRDEPSSEKETDKRDESKQPTTHTVKTDPVTRQRESWPTIAEQYGLSAKQLLELNPQYDAEPMSLAVGDNLTVSQPTEKKQTQTASYGFPPLSPDWFNHPLNTFYDYSERCLLHSAVKAISDEKTVEKELPVVNLKRERTLRVGVFFDGTGQNSPNDEYKETYGNKSRTNIARLFEAYPEQDGQSAKIYVSGVGTVDDIPIIPGERNPIIDAGGDEKLFPGQAFGVFDDTGGLWKWQTLLKEVNGIIRRLGTEYHKINHIQFDVFGFSRGAALARHFVNALEAGFPDYSNPERSKNPSEIYPNLLGNESYKRFDSLSDEFYAADTQRRISVRFVGLFDTVGSFYMPGNNDEGEYKLGLKPNAAEKVFQICAQHEYRENFPLTSLGKGHTEAVAFSDGIFFQEVFPGCHTDIGGGYPSKNKYGRTDLPARLNQPVDSTYHRKLTHKTSLYDKYQSDIQKFKSAHELATYAQQKLAQENLTWQQQTREEHGIHGEVKLVNGELHYYHFTPTSNALAGLTFERMKQQAEKQGVIWDTDALNKLKSEPFDEHDDSFITRMWSSMKKLPSGSIHNQWKKDEAVLSREYIHRPHDALINPGYESATERFVNALSIDSNNQPKRQVFSND